MEAFFNKADFSRDSTIFMISFISLFEIINTAFPEPRILLRIPEPADDAASVNPNFFKHS